jgi:UPF0271 protein
MWLSCRRSAGDFKTLRKAVELNVTIGAHVSYPDLVGFGRRNMDVSRDEIADVLYQISALDGLAKWLVPSAICETTWRTV